MYLYIFICSVTVSAKVFFLSQSGNKLSKLASPRQRRHNWPKPGSIFHGSCETFVQRGHPCFFAPVTWGNHFYYHLRNICYNYHSKKVILLCFLVHGVVNIFEFAQSSQVLIEKGLPRTGKMSTGCKISTPFYFSNQSPF